MKRFSEMMLLRIFVGEEDKYENETVYEKILEEALNRGLKGGTVLRGLIGFGASREIHSYHILSVSENLPVVVEIIDSKEKIEMFLPILDNILTKGVVTVENIRAYCLTK